MEVERVFGYFLRVQTYNEKDVSINDTVVAPQLSKALYTINKEHETIYFIPTSDYQNLKINIHNFIEEVNEKYQCLIEVTFSECNDLDPFPELKRLFQEYFRSQLMAITEDRIDELLNKKSSKDG